MPNLCHLLAMELMPDSKFACMKALGLMDDKDVVVDEDPLTPETAATMPLFVTCQQCFPDSTTEVQGHAVENMHETEAATDD